MKPIPKQLQRCIDCGDFDKAAHQLSAAYLLATVMNVYFETGCDILEKHDVIARDLKMQYKGILKHFDAFYRLFKSMTPPDKQMLFNEDYETLIATIEKFLNTKEI